MNVDEKQISDVVREIISRMEKEKGVSYGPAASSGDGVLFQTMEEAILAAKEAQRKLRDTDLETRKRLIDAMRRVSLKEAQTLAKMASRETGMGRWEDKVLKNTLAAEKTPGVEDLRPEAFTGDNGLTLVERAPYGIIGAVTPSTNPPSTIINNSISIIAAGNSVVFAPHPAAREVSQYTMQILSDAIAASGGPRGLITAMKTPSIEGAQTLFTHPDIRILLVTGGPGVVAAAMKSSKRVIAAGPGNPPVVVDETADFEKAVDSIIRGASFDNGILCTAEKEVLLADGAAEAVLERMRKDPRVHELSPEQMDRLASAAIVKGGAGCREPVLNREYVGRNASFIAKNALGIDLREDVRLLWGLVDEKHDFMWTEQLMPILPFARTGSIDRTIQLAVEMEGGNGHTAVMHSLNVDRLTKMAYAAACSIFVKNGPSYMGLGMGEGFASLSIATPTGDGLVSAKTFTRPLRCTLVDYFRIV
ncbi:MAG: aldehyde dehydrogenase EutE [Elusimicrobia bacterium]|nr:aldehyde dehydrogenase EutE [Elusimicrobiota bacterium]